MSRSARSRAFAVLATLALLAPTPDLRADGSCVTGFRATFQKITAPFRKVHDAVHAFLMRKSRAQLAEIQSIYDQNAGRGVEDWERDVTDRMTDRGKGNYPKLEELLALMAAKSPTFKEGLAEFLNDHGSIRFKVLAGMMRSIESDGGKVTWGSHFWTLWRTRIRLPTRETWTPDDFALFMTETSNALFRAVHPEPGFAAAWIKALGGIRLDPATWKIWQRFADKLLVDYRGQYKSFMEGVTTESYGRPRPDVIRDFYKWGMWDAVYRRLAALKVALSSSSGALIEKSTGLTPGEIDSINTNPLYSALPRAIKNALIISKNPALYKDLLYDAEVEQLSLEVRWFTQPVIEGMILYTSLIEPAYSAYEWNERRKELEADVRAHPDRYLPKNERADADRISSYEDQIKLMSAEKTALEHEMPGLSNDEQAQRRKAIDRLERRITVLQQLKADLLSGVPKGHG